VQALEFARQYVALVDALMKQGVAEETAREEARMAALLLIFQKDNSTTGTCPLCSGKGDA
jgi:hypothetical protein